MRRPSGAAAVASEVGTAALEGSLRPASPVEPPDLPDCPAVKPARRLLPAVAFALLAAACATGERPTLVPGSTLPDGDAAPVVEVEAEATEATTTTTVPDSLPVTDEGFPDVPTEGRVRGLITPTGVVVEVLEDLGDRYEVRTPCGETALLRWGTPLYGAHVMIDPGHGGDIETGAVGDAGTVEAELNLEVALSIAAEMRSRGLVVVLSRHGDYRVPIVSRAQLADALDVDAVISLHHNAPNPGPSDEPGTEIYVQDGRAQARRLGGLIYREVTNTLARADVSWVGAGDAGVLSVVNSEGEDAYGIVRRPAALSVIIEFGYLSNPSEEELFNSETYADDMGTAVADAVERWFLTDDGGTGFVDVPRVFNPGGTGGLNGCVDPPLERIGDEPDTDG